jgi:hypothetical protein
MPLHAYNFKKSENPQALIHHLNQKTHKSPLVEKARVLFSQNLIPEKSIESYLESMANYFGGQDHLLFYGSGLTNFKALVAHIMELSRSQSILLKTSVLFLSDDELGNILFGNNWVLESKPDKQGQYALISRVPVKGFSGTLQRQAYWRGNRVLFTIPKWVPEP